MLTAAVQISMVRAHLLLNKRTVGARFDLASQFPPWFKIPVFRRNAFWRSD